MSWAKVRPYACQAGRSTAGSGSRPVAISPGPWSVLLGLLVLVPAALGSAAPGSVISWGTYFGPGRDAVPREPCAAICAGGYHSLAIRVDGSLVAWGDSARGQCNVPPGRGFVAVAAGLYHNLALRSDGSLVAWGDNTRGQCQVPRDGRYRAIAAGHWHSLAIRLDGSLVAWGWNDQKQCNVPMGNDFVAVSAGYSHSLALRANGSLVAWGDNSYHQCDVPAGENFIRAAAGSLHNIALRSSGTIAAWGRNKEGQCDAPTGSDFVAVAAGSLHSCALTRDGRVVAWGPRDSGECQAPAERRYAALAAGAFHNLAICGSPTEPVPLRPAGTLATDGTPGASGARPSPAARSPDPVPLAAGSGPLVSVRSPSTSPDDAVRPALRDPGETARTDRANDRGPSLAASDANKPGAAPLQTGETKAARQERTPATSAVEPNHVIVRGPGADEKPKLPMATPQSEPVAEPNATAACHTAPPTDRASDTQGSKTPIPVGTADGTAPDVESRQTITPSSLVPPATQAPSRAERKPAPGAPSADDPNKARATSMPPAASAGEPNAPLDLTHSYPESMAADAFVGVDANVVPVYHFTSVGRKQHLYTISDKEKYALIDDRSDTWKYQGIAFFAYPAGRQPPGARPVYHFSSESLKQHFYTVNERDKQTLLKEYVKIWKYEGIAWYAPPARPVEKK